MKLKNKRTGEIGVVNYYDHCLQVVKPDASLCGNSILGDYRTLAELCEEWSDYKEPEPKGYWYITSTGCVVYSNYDNGIESGFREGIGNHFSSEEEAKKAIKKLSALDELKYAGITFDGWRNKMDTAMGQMIEITAYVDDVKDVENELDLLFSQKDEE